MLDGRVWAALAAQNFLSSWKEAVGPANRRIAPGLPSAEENPEWVVVSFTEVFYSLLTIKE